MPEKTHASTTSADVVIAGTGIVACLIAEQMLDAGLSVLMLEAGPRIERGGIIENFRNLPPMQKFAQPDGPFPPKPWAMHPMDFTGNPDKDYLITSGPDAVAYQQTYVRYAGGATWHWAGTLWRLTPEDMQLNSKFGVGRDWPFDYSVLEPYYTRAEYAIGAAGPSDPADQWPPIRSRPYMMEAFPFGSGQQQCVTAAAKIGMRYIPCAQARNNNTAFQGRPPCSGNNNCDPVCPIGAKYDAYGALLRIEAKGGVVATNAVVYRVETDDKNNVQAFHYFSPDKTSTRVTGKTFVLACNGIESPKILLMSKNDKNPNGVANRSDQVGRNMMDTPKMVVALEFKEPVWVGLGPVQTGAIMSTTQGDFRSQHAGGQISLINFAMSSAAGIMSLKKKLVGKALDAEIRRATACSGLVAVEHEIPAYPHNRLTLSDKKDALGLSKPQVYYDVTDYVRKSADVHTFPTVQRFGEALGADKVVRVPGFVASQHIMGGAIMGKDPQTSVVDADCRAHDHPNLFIPGGAAMPSGGSGNSTLTMAALAVKAADAIQSQTKGG
jgi:choline dehydrogenase-like flavoprotein